MTEGGTDGQASECVTPLVATPIFARADPPVPPLPVSPPASDLSSHSQRLPTLLFPAPSFRCSTFRLSPPSFTQSTHIHFFCTRHSKYLDGIITQTTLAHRLLLKAWKLGGQQKQQALLTVLFKGYFEELVNIGDTDVLADAAVRAGLFSRDEVRFLFSFHHLGFFGLWRWV